MRKTIEVEIMDRGNPRRFTIQEFSATQGEAWFIKVVSLLTKANFAGVVEQIMQAYKMAKADEDGSEAFNMETIKAICTAISTLPLSDAMPLWDELLSCCTRTDGGVNQPCSLSTIDGFLESPMSLLKLKLEAAKLNLAFLFEGGADNALKAASLFGKRK